MTKYEYEIKRQRWETLDTAVARLCKWIPICVICYFGYLSISALAGKATLAQFGLWIFADLKATKAFSHVVTSLFGLGGVTFGYRERKLRQKNIERMSAQLTEYEIKIDPKRSSSRLTKKGSTRPEDTL
jgi:hypothetical protein